MSSQPDKVVLGGNFNLAYLNETYNNIKDIIGESGEVDDAAFISVDSLGADVRIRRGGEYSVERLGWVNRVESLEDACRELEQMMKELTN